MKKDYKTGDARILGALLRFKRKKLTPMEAWVVYGVYRLSGAIHRLRNGISTAYSGGPLNIQKKMIEVENKYGVKIRVAGYFIAEEDKPCDA